MTRRGRSIFAVHLLLAAGLIAWVGRGYWQAEGFVLLTPHGRGVHAMTEHGRVLLALRDGYPGPGFSWHLQRWTVRRQEVTVRDFADASDEDQTLIYDLAAHAPQWFKPELQMQQDPPHVFRSWWRFHALPLVYDAVGRRHRQRSILLIAPVWALALPLLPWPVRRVSLALRGRRRRRRGMCVACGYDLRHSPGRCPECGAVPGVAGNSSLDMRE